MSRGVGRSSVVRINASLPGEYGEKVALAAEDFGKNFTEWLRTALDAYTAKRVNEGRALTPSELVIALHEADMAATELRLQELTQRREQRAKQLMAAKAEASKDREERGLLTAEQVAELYWRQSEDMIRRKALENALDPDHVVRLAEETFRRNRLEQQREATARAKAYAQSNLRVLPGGDAR